MATKNTLQIPPNTVFVLGAGVDYALGLPLMNSMFRELSAFARGNGKLVDKAIRKHGRVHVNLAAYAGEEGEHLGKKLLGSHSHLLPVIQKALGKHLDPSEPNVKAMKTMVSQLERMAKANVLKGSTAAQLQKIAGESSAGVGADTLLDTEHIVLETVPRQAMRKIFAGVLADKPALGAKEREAFEAVVAALSNFEELLGDFFAGYFTRNPSAQKKYFYLAWLLWAYIRVREHEGLGGRDQSFYKTLSEVAGKSEIITFNYTDFFYSHTRPKNGYFHGDSRSYIRFDTREYVTDNADVVEADSVEKAAAFISGLRANWDHEGSEVDLPAIVPPLSMKPIICTEYLERWYECGQKIKAAKVIVAVGYSFSAADEHFNDLIRKQNKTARIVVVNPALDAVVTDVCRITGQDKKVLAPANIATLECMRGGRLTFVKAKAEEVTGAQLVELLET